MVIRREGYETLKTHWDVRPPWFQLVPLDFFAEVLWPGHVHDTHARHFVLEPQQLPKASELIERALTIREQALTARP